MSRSRAAGHGGGHGHDAVVLFGEPAKRFAENVCIGRRSSGGLGLRLACGDVELAQPVEFGRLSLGGRVPLPLAGEHVQQDRLIVDGGRHPQMAFHFLDIVPVHRTDVVEAQGLEKHTRREYGLEAAVRAMGVFRHFIANAGDGLEPVLDFPAYPARPAAFHVAAEEEGQRADIVGDRHLVVVQDHDEAPAHVARLVQPFKGQPSGEGAVSDDREHMVFLSRQIPSHRHAESRGNGCRGVSDAEMIKRAFFDFRKTADASKLAQGMEVFRPSGQQLPCVALVPHIPDELVFLRVEYGKERERQLDDAERGGQMPSVGGNRADNGLAQFRRQDLLVGEGQVRHHGRVRDTGEKGRKGTIRFVHEECVPVVWAGCRGLGAGRLLCGMRNSLYSSALSNWQTDLAESGAPRCGIGDASLHRFFSGFICCASPT